MQQFTKVHPVLPCRNVAQAIQYYCQRLGFTLSGQDSQTDPHYAIVRRDAVELHLQWHEPATFEQAVDKLNLRFPINDIQRLHDEYAAQDVFHEKTALRETPWGTREFAFYDLNMNGLTFYTDIELEQG